MIIQHLCFVLSCYMHLNFTSDFRISQSCGQILSLLLQSFSWVDMSVQMCSRHSSSLGTALCLKAKKCSISICRNSPSPCELHRPRPSLDCWLKALFFPVNRALYPPVSGCSLAVDKHLQVSPKSHCSLLCRCHWVSFQNPLPSTSLWLSFEPLGSVSFCLASDSWGMA